MCVVAQRLGRRLCNECKRLMDPPPPKERLLEVGFVEEDLKDAQIYEAVGCSRCKGGYAGRFAILESMPISEAVRRIIIAGGSAIDIKDQAMKEQMISLRRCGLLNVLRGKTSIEEVLRSTTGD